MIDGISHGEGIGRVGLLLQSECPAQERFGGGEVLFLREHAAELAEGANNSRVFGSEGLFLDLDVGSFYTPRMR